MGFGATEQRTVVVAPCLMRGSIGEPLKTIGTGRVAGLLTTKNNRSSCSCARTFSSLSLARPSSFHLGLTSHCRIVVECLNRASPYTHPPPTKPRPTPHSAPLLLSTRAGPPSAQTRAQHEVRLHNHLPFTVSKAPTMESMARAPPELDGSGHRQAISAAPMRL